MPWMFYSPAVALSNEGLTLMASALLDRLHGFRSRQLATYGVSALPASRSMCRRRCWSLHRADRAS